MNTLVMRGITRWQTFSPELAPIANPSLMALSDGAVNQDIVHLPKNRYRIPSYPFVDDLRYHRLIRAYLDNIEIE